MSAAGVCAELVAPVANMLAAAVAAGRLVSTTAGIPTRVASGVGDASVAGGTSAQATEVEAKEVEVKEVEVKEIEVKERSRSRRIEGERADEGTGHPLGPRPLLIGRWRALQRITVTPAASTASSAHLTGSGARSRYGAGSR